MRDNIKTMRVAIIFGGPSAEHEISLLSARNICKALSNIKNIITLPIGITRKREWILIEDWKKTLEPIKRLPKELKKESGLQLSLLPGNSRPIRIYKNQKSIEIDLFFPIVHGQYGEDGSLQGLLKQLDFPYVGADVLSSSVCMDKLYMKRLLIGQLPVAKFLSFKRPILADNTNKIDISKITGLDFGIIKSHLGLPFYVKPANLGSSIGIHRVSEAENFTMAIEDAFRYDSKILIEKNIDGREIECAIIGNRKPKASPIGEISVEKDFYSFKNKYIDKKGAILHIPSQISIKEKKMAQETALKAFEILGLEGLARVDMFLCKKNGKSKIWINEVNTLPGFTDISMYPSLWRADGLSLQELLLTLMELAKERHFQQKQLSLQAPSISDI